MNSIRFHLCINLLSVPAICTELVILAWPGNNIPTVVCVFLGWTVGFINLNRYLGGLPIAICRSEEKEQFFETELLLVRSLPGYITYFKALKLLAS